MILLLLPGTFLSEWGTGTLNPTDIAIDRTTDTVFVTIQFSDVVRKFTTEGPLIGEWGSTGSGDGQFRFPRGIALDSDGSVYVSDIIPNTKTIECRSLHRTDSSLRVGDRWEAILLI
jgi:DNA-binding beta-propeller fold protein YncE